MLDASAPALAGTSLVQPVKFQSIISLSGFRDAGLDAALGVTLPRTPKHVVQGERAYLWNGPNAWLVLSENPGLYEGVLEAVGGLAAVTDQSDGICLFRVIGPHVRSALAKLVPIDLHPSAFGPEDVAMTLAGHVAVRIWQEADGAFVLGCFRSFAAALHHSLVEATLEFTERD